MRGEYTRGLVVLHAVSLVACAGGSRLTLDECRARYESQMAAEQAERERPRTIAKTCDRRDRDCLNRLSPGLDDADTTAAVTRAELYSRQFEECQMQAVKPP